MNVRTLCLAILQAGDATGYEIKKLSVEGNYSYFVDASFGSIYPALARLEAEGLVTVREEAQSGRPSRKVYSITEAGRRALVAELSELPSPDIFRSEFLLVAMCADLLPRRCLRAAIDQRIRELTGKLEHLGRIAGNAQSPGTRWIAEYGRVCTEVSLNHVKAHRHALEDIAEQDDTVALPAAAE